MKADRETRIEEKLDRVAESMAEYHGKFSSHEKNHVTQPCGGLKVLSNRLFAIAVLAVGGLLTAVGALLAQLWKYVPSIQ